MPTGAFRNIALNKNFFAIRQLIVLLGLYQRVRLLLFMYLFFQSDNSSQWSFLLFAHKCSAVIIH